MISILIPIYNGIEFIEESVGSVINQTFNDWELLIGINGHSENSEVYQTAKKYEEINSKIKVFDLFYIKGKSNTLNKMVELSNFNFIALLDVDDIWHTQKLELQYQYLSHYDVIGSNCIWFGKREGIIPPIPIGDISNFNFFKVNPIINSSSIIRKNYCHWNNEFDGVEDYDLWLRLRRGGAKFFNLKQILVKHRIHDGSAFNAKGNNNKVSQLLICHNS